MKEYRNDLFYKGNITNIESFKEDVIKHSYNIVLEQKYKNNVSHREESELSLEQTLNLIKTDKDFKIVHIYPNFNRVERFQVVFVKNWYFAWCSLDVKHEKYFIKKYELKNMV